MGPCTVQASDKMDLKKISALYTAKMVFTTQTEDSKCMPMSPTGC